MVEIRLKRIAHTAHGVFGALIPRDVPICVTLEEPWNDNRQESSCIPPGEYLCRKHNGPKYQNVWRLIDVPGRDGILIHEGNTIKNTTGCILVGMGYGVISGIPGIIQSIAALNMLRRELPAEFTLTIGG